MPTFQDKENPMTEVPPFLQGDLPAGGPPFLQGGLRAGMPSFLQGASGAKCPPKPPTIAEFDPKKVSKNFKHIF